MARGSYNYGCFLIRHDEYADAIPFIADAVSGYREDAKYSWLADAYRWQAKAYSGVGDKDRALADFARAVEIYVDIEHYVPATIAQLDVVELLGFLDRQDEALAATASALEHAEASGDPYLPMRVNDRAAAALIDLGEYDLALDRLRDCLGVAEYVNDTQSINYQTHRLGATLVLRGIFLEALEFLNRANEAFREADSLSEVVETDLGVLECLFALGRTSEAQSLLRRLEAVTRPARFTQTRAVILMVRAEALVAAGNPRAADQLCTEALILAEEVSDELLARKVRILRAEALLEDEEFALAFDQIYDIPVDDFGQNRVWRARLLAVRAAVRGPVEGHLTLAEIDIQENIALGAAIGFARYHGRSYEQLSAIRFSEGRRDDARTLQVKATAIYLRAGLTALAEKAAANLLPDTYLLRTPSTGPFARPELISSGPASRWLVGRELEAMMDGDYDAGISEGRRNVAIGSEVTMSDGSRNDRTRRDSSRNSDNGNADNDNDGAV